ncbi:MAG: UbiA-like polyprenyltransferase [Terracidiphilus sp.]|nr:UbiA-like polyprenyltransferase [Terracidiphilus sp.]MDR3798041.1 UbiA-like polyprenyltransferase [Terracidiphilus sp.]
MAGVLSKIRTTLEMIKWEHSIFALPFALTAMLLAAGGLPGWRTVAWIVVAMVAARSAAMAFNRWADADLDAENPRTRNRAIPAGLLTRKFVLGFISAAVLVFFVAAAELNRLTLELAPLALAVLLGYSYLKRFTRWSHLGLGLALGLAPAAAWIAVRGSLDPRILVLTAAVTLWAGGFDVLYACQDFEHDRAAGLHSLPQAVGIPMAFGAARVLHVAALGALAWFAWLFHFGLAGWLGIAAVGLLLAYEHAIVSPRDLRRLNAAFFTMNGVIAMVFLAFVSADLWLRHGEHFTR